MTKQITAAFAGPGDMKVDAIRDLLNDYFHFGEEDADGIPEDTEDDLTLVFPISRTWSHKGLDKVLDWSDYVDKPFNAVTDGNTTKSMDDLLDQANEVSEVEDVAEGLIDVLVGAQGGDGESVLIVLWPQDENEDVADYYERLVDLAAQEEIKTLSLTDGLDTLRLAADEPEPEPEPAPAPRGRRRSSPPEPSVPLAKDPEPEPPTRGRRRSKPAEETLESTEEPLTDKDVVPDPEPTPTRRGRGRTPEENKKTADEALSSLREVRTKAAASRETPEAPAEAQNAAEARLATARGYATNIARYFSTAEANRAAANPGIHVEPAVLSVQAQALAILLEAATLLIVLETDGEPSAQVRGRGRPRKDGSPAQPRSEEDKGTPYIVEDGRYRKAGPGRKPRGQVRESLSLARIEELTEQGLVDEE